ncbi:MAG: caspase family protein [Bacteroidales bacterium]|nr:caspase family protein [Bacteroidales bacterium]MBN2748163.1 caspase family protein [Bacteroidales bacterium]
MNTGRKSILLVLAMLALSMFPAKAQEIIDLQSRQLGEKINLEYSIVGEKIGQLFTVTPFYSTNGGKTFVPMKSVTGNVGQRVMGGKNQIIIWDALKDTKELNGDVVFKLVANGKSIEATEQLFSKVNFKLESLHKKDNNQLELVLNITNNGPARDLKLINGLITITDFNKQKYDAQRGNLGGVAGNERYSTPQRKIKTGESVKAVFTFDRIPSDLNRIMRLDIGAELLTIDIGLDLEIGNLQFRDLPVTTAKTAEMKSEISKKAQAVTQPMFYAIKKAEEIKQVADITPPTFTITAPENVALIGSEATRGRPYAQSTILADDKRKRSVTGGELDLIVTNSQLTVKGQAKDESGIFEVKVNGKNATLSPNGTFETTLALASGKNDVVIRVLDSQKNSAEKKFIVVYQVQGKPVSSETEELDLIFDEEKRMPQYYAVIVGVNEYPDTQIADLSNPISDAQKLFNVLTTRYTFEPSNVIFIQNASRGQLIDELDKLTRRVTKNDNLLIFFAGHGYWDKDTELGYWLPSDARATSTANWMANSQIRDYIRAIKSKHTLLIADACFSGGIFKTLKAFEEGSAPLTKAYDKPSRKAMTSGALTEVPDQSIFLEQLVKRLSENTQDYISAEEVFSSIRNVVMNGSPTTPLYGDIKDTGDEGGDFLFVKK